MINKETRGLYESSFEHDNCGIGLLTQLRGEKSHQMITDALKMLCRLEHRGGQGAETNSGDGAGILVQLPDCFFRQVVPFALPTAQSYAVGMVFLAQNMAVRAKQVSLIEDVLQTMSLTLLGWRDVPIDPKMLGNAARIAMPFICQLFVKKYDGWDQDVFERKLFVARKQIEQKFRTAEGEVREGYFASFSSKTIVYKGMLTTEQVGSFYVDLCHPQFKSALALVHSRFSTNTFPSWKRAHPNRCSIHNGEINTIQGNVNWMRAREATFRHSVFTEEIDKVLPIIDESGSDSAIFDQTLEFLMLSGRSLFHAAMMMVPEPWESDLSMSPQKRAFYAYHRTLMEPWDGPSALVYTDGTKIGAMLDRNGLRPARYYRTSDDYFVLSSEAGVLPYAPEEVVEKGRLKPGQLLAIDLERGCLLGDDEVKASIIWEEAYTDWVDQHILSLDEVKEGEEISATNPSEMTRTQRAFGYTYEELTKMIFPLIEDGSDPVGSMGYDSPLAVLSTQPQLLYNYFKQSFAQVTNPPIDAIREKVVTSVETTIGSRGHLLARSLHKHHTIHLNTPILTNEDLAKVKSLNDPGLKAAVLEALYDVSDEGTGLETAIEQLCAQSEAAIKSGATLLILSDRNGSKTRAAIPALLAVGALHQHLILQGLRMNVSLIVETGDAREVHHHATLIGYGAEAICPYVVFDIVKEAVATSMIQVADEEEACRRYVAGVTSGLMKVLSKMGVSTIQSYRGAQIFEAIGLHSTVINRYFTGTPSRIGGIDLSRIAKDVRVRHEQAWLSKKVGLCTLASGDDWQWRQDGETHQYSPETIHLLQRACRSNDDALFKRYAALVNGEDGDPTSLKALLKFRPQQRVSIEEVEPASDIVKRFRTGAMSYGSISKEAHETLAIAMNRLGGKSNTGEGGEESVRFFQDDNGNSRRSAIKQVASGRFGVTSHYLVNADEIQIKVAQGAKPGEGGQLPGDKVYPWVAEVRGSTPGVGLISPPPHHDIYSIEDLAQLIFDLKNANPSAKISVKLVSGTGVGTIAAGVVKAGAEGIVISGYDGGTGAAARTSIKHTGLPWEIGLADTQQTLILNGLRDRVTLETDGKLMTGRDVIIAALLGAEEYAFSTAPLVVLGCVMMRVCHLDTCPIGIATQNEDLRKLYTGQADHVVNFMTFVAEEMREWMASLGVRTVDELIGRVDLLEQAPNERGIDLSRLLWQPSSAGVHRCMRTLPAPLTVSPLAQLLRRAAEPALQKQERITHAMPVSNTDRAIGTVVGSEISKRYGVQGLPADTVTFSFHGSAGQSFGAFIPEGMTLYLQGDANDYVGKGLSGGKIVLYPPKHSTFCHQPHVIAGNTTFYGATSGEAYIAGQVGERFCVRNAGAHVVVEGMGDHGLEYMTGGQVINIGTVGRNFAAGMSGGVAYMYDPDRHLPARCNHEMVLLEGLSASDVNHVHTCLMEHVNMTGSPHAQALLNDWQKTSTHFMKVVSKDEKQMLARIDEYEKQGYPSEEARLLAFENKKQGRVPNH
ncbi:glutamate synthase large subunit [Bacillus sp. FSL W7-1360]